MRTKKTLRITYTLSEQENEKDIHYNSKKFRIKSLFKHNLEREFNIYTFV